MIKIEYLSFFIIKFEKKFIPASWLIVAFSDADQMFQFSLLFIEPDYS